MGSSTFSGPVISQGGVYSSGNAEDFQLSSGTITGSAKTHGGKLLGLAASTILTLPEIVATGTAQNVGMKFRFYSAATAVTGQGALCSGSDKMIGSVTVALDNSAISETYFSDGTDTFLSMNGTTKGGIIGSYFECTAVSATTWLVTGMVMGSGAIVTPFG